MRARGVRERGVRGRGRRKSIERERERVTIP